MSDQTPIDTTTAIPVKTAVPKVRWTIEVRAYLAVWMAVSMFGLIVMCWYKSPDPTNQIFNSLISIYGATGFVTVMGYWFGSSKGSDDKTAMLKKDTQ